MKHDTQKKHLWSVTHRMTMQNQELEEQHEMEQIVEKMQMWEQKRWSVTPSKTEVVDGLVRRTSPRKRG